MIWDSRAPAADTAGLSRLWAATRQRDGLDILCEASGLSQTDHCEAVEGRAVKAVTDYISDDNVLLSALFHSHVMFPKRCNGTVGSERTRRTEGRKKRDTKRRRALCNSGRHSEIDQRPGNNDSEDTSF